MQRTNLSLLSSSVFSHFLIKCVIAFISEFIPNDEDEGSSPDSALDETTRLTHERRRPTLQEVRLKNYFNSVESSSCASCEHVKIYCVQETTT